MNIFSAISSAGGGWAFGCGWQNKMCYNVISVRGLGNYSSFYFEKGWAFFFQIGVAIRSVRVTYNGFRLGDVADKQAETFYYH